MAWQQLPGEYWRLASSLMENHKKVRVWRDKHGVWKLSREAMYTPELRETFVLSSALSTVPVAARDGVE